MRRRVGIAICLVVVPLAAGGMRLEEVDATTSTTTAVGGVVLARASLKSQLRHAHRRHRQPGLPAVVCGRRAEGLVLADQRPDNGKGFEPAVAYAVAKKLGFPHGQVKWVYVPFNRSFAPGPKSFDFDINQISYTPERAKVVSFSSSYYDVNQALVVLAGNEDREGAHGRGAEAVQARRAARDDELLLHHGHDQAVASRRPSSRRTRARSRR